MKQKKGRGRPRKIDPTRKRVSVDQAVEITKEFWAQFQKKGYSKGYIYNLTANGTLSKEKHGRDILLYEDEVREKLCG